ncbi:hypothetical protein DS901_00175 [Loktanella sp. D2R18]|uniref:DUF2125 domain-containing protein n=1 Tax=Rhodobacterales TaxID=204455 RepID=UPI000DE9EEBA|nr:MULTISPECIES: DUF2125 domain-containing protein [Rhodobacterales]MDO6591986.1 DUF2125 domain-containing protein [Yoonia sp. 1_MG-2023]RBW46171.1 hypothetical protein DS901_00175 [Loktanella sp. D2R18]
MTYCIALPATLAIFGTPAIADITSDDVWANQNALYTAFGLQVSADRIREGSTVFINDMVMTYALPMGFGEISISVPPMTMVDEPDGTVTMTLPKSMDYTLAATIPMVEPEPIQATMNLQQSNMRMTASGEPGVITYDSVAGVGTASLTSASMFPDLAEMVFGFTVNSGGYTVVSTVTEGEMIAVTTEYVVEPMTYEFMSDFGEGQSTDTNTIGRTQVSTNSAIPAEGFDLLNLAPALRAGMFMQSTQTTESVQAEHVTMANGQVFMALAHQCGPATYNFGLSDQGLVFAGIGDGCEISVQETQATQIAGIPGEIDIVVGATVADIIVPLLKSDTAQTARYHIGFDDLTVSENTWAMFDPDQVLSRDPMDMNIDLSAGLTYNVEWLDFLNIENELMIQQTPVELHDLRIDAFDIAGTGASLATTGAFAFDMTDLDTFDGMPRPTGAAGMTVTGAHALLDNLIALDLLNSDDVFGMRMGLGMFTRDDGNGTLTTSVEIDDAGSVRVNGERVR